MAEAGEGLWFNPVSGEQELVNGVYCSCYSCRKAAEIYGDCYTKWRGSWFFSKLEFKKHQKERRASYLARKSESAKGRTKSRTQETGVDTALGGTGAGSIPTRFDIYTGKWNTEETVSSQFDRLFGWKSYYQ